MLCAVLASAGVAFALPTVAGAFWPLSVTKADSNPVPVLHDANLPLLDAPINADPNAAAADSTITTTSDGSALVPGVAPDATPNGSASVLAQDTVTTPTNGSISEYTVKSGDNLSQIAANFGVTVNTILWANNIKDPSTIKAGTKLVILPVSGIQHTVRAGETISSIAQKFGGDPADIAQFNGLADGSALQAGSTIIIPGGELTASNTTSSTKNGLSSNKKTTSSSKSSGSSNTSSAESITVSTPSGVTHYSDATGNPYKGGSGAQLSDFFTNPLPGAILTQSIHGWNAVDLGAPAGTPIHAAASGTVILARVGGWNGGYGNYVILDNGHGVQTLYAHMTSVGVSVGDSVSTGETIGTVGKTGDATGNHLHFEVRGARNPYASCTEMTVCSPNL